MDIMLGFEERHTQFLSLWHRNRQHLWGVKEHLLSLKSQLEFASWPVLKGIFHPTHLTGKQAVLAVVA